MSDNSILVNGGDGRYPDLRDLNGLSRHSNDNIDDQERLVVG